jgi:plastocyanin
MRRLGLILAVMAVSAATLAIPPLAHGDGVPFVPGECKPEPGDQGAAPPAGCQRILFKYGPVHVTPGDNLILIGPVVLEKPMQDGWITRFKPDLVRVTGEVPPIEELHLHHAVWISSRYGFPWAASGEEKTMLSLPSGYAMKTSPSDQWLLNYMLHNQLVTPENVFITYEIDFVPKSVGDQIGLKEVMPVWLNVGSFNGANPVYNTLQGWGRAMPGECAFPKESCASLDPYGKAVVGNGLAGNGLGWTLGPVGGSRGVVPAGTVVWMAGHLHPGGKRVDVNLMRAGKSTPVFSSHAQYFDPGGPISWDMVMETTKPGYKLQINPGDTFVVNSVYETEKASWYEGMGIVVMFIAPNDSSGPDAWSKDFKGPNFVGVTHGHLAEANNHGGPDLPGAVDGPRVTTGNVGIAGFSYLPGNLGTAKTVGIPQVKRGQTITFTNLDAYEQIFHTVTACKAPCNGATGISYPLANAGASQFDSLELGYGPPPLTAAANRNDYKLDTSSLDPGTYTYFCRIHPSMRGAFAVAA